jgi:hypothetical protein
MERAYHHICFRKYYFIRLHYIHKKRYEKEDEQTERRMVSERHGSV